MVVTSSLAIFTPLSNQGLSSSSIYVPEIPHSSRVCNVAAARPHGLESRSWCTFDRCVRLRTALAPLCVALYLLGLCCDFVMTDTLSSFACYRSI